MHSSPYASNISPPDVQRYARERLMRDTSWRQDFVGLQLRTLCVPPNEVKKGFENLCQTVNTATMVVLDPVRDPALAKAMAFATLAGIASLLLYRRVPVVLSEAQREKQEWAQGFYTTRVMARAHTGNTDATLSDLRCLAIECTLKPCAGVSHRNGPLLKDDPRWCLAAAPSEWPSLQHDYPYTKQYLEPFSMLCSLVEPTVAQREVWYRAALKDTLVLPELDLCNFLP